MEHEDNKNIVSETEKREMPNSADKKRFVDKEFKSVFKGVAVLIIAVIIFFAGMIVGRIQYRFTYNRISRGLMVTANDGFEGGPSSMTPTFYNTPGILGQGRGMIPNSNGIKGVISSIGNNQIVVQGANGVSENIAISAETVIKNQNQDIKISDLKAGQNIVVIGDPDSQGGITAKFIGIEK
jgi:hypothetical protein